MDAIQDLRQRMSAASSVRWIRLATNRILDYAKSAQGVAPFTGIAFGSHDKDRVRWWVNTRINTIDFYGMTPNLAQVKGVRLPLKKYHKTQPYRAGIDGEFFTLRKAQTLTPNPGSPFDVRAYVHGHAYGLAETDGFFGAKPQGKKMAFARIGKMAGPSYADQDYVGWLIEHYGDDVEKIMMDTGMEILDGLI